MTNARQTHLVSVWNPSYEADAMEQHLSVLLANAARFRKGEGDEEDVYVWWGKIRSANRQQPMPHLADVLAIDAELGGEGETVAAEREVHLYLTDYRSLYVAHVAEIVTDDMRDDDGHVPAFYAAGDFNFDCWFQLWDIRRLVTNDTLGVVEELRKLRNTRYNDRPVSIYGGMVDLPLIVTRADGARYFDPAVRAALTDGRFWCEFDAERSGVGAMERELRENLFGSQAWSGLDAAARSFIASAEKVFRDHRSDPAFDFSGVVVDYAKAFEVQANGLLRQAVAGAARDVRLVNVDGQSVDLARGSMLSLGQLARVMGENRALNDWLKRQLKPGEWVAASLPPILNELAALRNPAAHGTRISREQVTPLRDTLVGVGCTGRLVELGNVRPR
jgi:hypothetical protein